MALSQLCPDSATSQLGNLSESADFSVPVCRPANANRLTLGQPLASPEQATELGCASRVG